MPETITAWRVTKAKYRSTALSGRGGLIHQGRWHRKGVEVVYAAENPSLALLETLVHVEEAAFLCLEYVGIPIRFERRFLQVLAPNDLPDDWNMWPWPASTQRIGTEWLLENRSVLLQVPSVVVPSQANYLLNPSHPDFEYLEIGEPISFNIDQRLSRLR